MHAQFTANSSLFHSKMCMSLVYCDPTQRPRIRRDLIKASRLSRLLCWVKQLLNTVGYSVKSQQDPPPWHYLTAVPHTAPLSAVVREITERAHRSCPVMDKPCPQPSTARPVAQQLLGPGKWFGPGKTALQNILSPAARTVGPAEYQLVNREVGARRLSSSWGQHISSSEGFLSTELCSARSAHSCTRSGPQMVLRWGWRELTTVYPIPQCSSVKCYCFPEARNIILP